MNAIQTLLTDHLDLWTAADTEKKSGRGRSSGNAASVYGIKKLRELILVLAVRGKLVPQDPKEEPAGELLKRIAAEKARLIAEGKIKKDKSLPLITEDEKPFDLPNGWAYSNLGDVVEIVRGITFPGTEKSKDPADGRIACLRTTNVQDQIEWDDILYIREKFVSREDQLLKPCDIVMSMANSRELVGKVALVGEKINQKTTFGGFLGVLRPFLIDPRFVMALLRTPHAREMLIDSASQTTNIANVSLAKLRPLFFAIPPLAEQHRIVAKVDELMALCDQLEQQQTHSIEAHQALVEILLDTLTRVESQQEFSAAWARIASHFDTLFITEASIDQLKQTILQLAVMGKLVPQDTNDEPASMLMRRCIEQKSLLIEQGKIRAEKPLPEIKNDEKEWELPVGWAWERLGNVFSGGSGTTPLRSNANYFINGTENWFKTTDLNLAVVMEGEEKVTKQAVEECNLTYYPPRTVCIAMYGGAGTIGKSGVLGVESTINQSVFALPPVEQILPEYLHIFVKTVRDKWMQYAAGLRKDPNINGLIIKKMVMPVPPKEEQHRIVAKVDELMALCDSLKARLADAQAIQLHLADAIVEQAVC